MNKVIYISLYSMWFSTLLSFVLGTLVSNFLLFFSYALVIVAVVMNKRKKFKFIFPSILIMVLILILIGYIFFGELFFTFDTASYNSLNAFKQSMYYLRGALIITIIYFCVNIRKEKTFETLIVCVFLTSMLILQGVTFNFLNINGSVFSLVPESLTVRQYTGFTGFFNNPNYWSIFLLLNLFLCFAGLSKYQYNNKLLTSLLLISIIILVISILFTGSRMAMIILVLCSLMLTKFGSWKSIILCALLFLIACSAIMLNFEFISSLNYQAIEKAFSRMDRLVSNVAEEDRFYRAAFYMNYISEDYINIFFGIGLATLLDVGAPHNSLITLFRDFGVILPLLVIMIFFLFVFFKLRQNTLELHELIFCKACLISLPLFFLTNDVFDSRPFWILLGLFIAYLNTKREAND